MNQGESPCEVHLPGVMTKRALLLLSEGERGKHRKFIIGRRGAGGGEVRVWGWDSKESSFELKTSNVLFRHQMILNQQSGKIGVFPRDSALTTVVMMLTSAVNQFEMYWWKVVYNCYVLLSLRKKGPWDLNFTEDFVTWKKGVSPRFSVCYVHENVFHYEPLSLCESHLSLGKKTRHWWVIAQTISEWLNESAEGGTVVYRILHLTIQEIRGLLGKSKAGSWKLLMYCPQNCLKWVHSWGRQKTRKAL